MTVVNGQYVQDMLSRSQSVQEDLEDLARLDPYWVNKYVNDRFGEEEEDMGTITRRVIPRTCRSFYCTEEELARFR